jgi:hypothetical protein
VIGRVLSLMTGGPSSLRAAGHGRLAAPAQLPDPSLAECEAATGNGGVRKPRQRPAIGL